MDLSRPAHSSFMFGPVRTEAVICCIDPSSRMKESANRIVESLQEINSCLCACIRNIKRSVADLDVFCVFTADEKKRILNLDKLDIKGFEEKYALVKLGYEPTASLTIEYAQAVVNEIGPTTTEMEEELGQWDDINQDLISILSFIDKEEDTRVQIIARLDNAQILERWQELGDIGMFY
ncbi:hypothetical protein CJF31_00011090 [Rutstroemia sp. NJR-2017a BVV2]|nr:hypothetical protein CJF31_00009924 [Rutstroemia sp. NJR-2017a BVV2]PQE21709.1 hypothetical protein CJF31_00011090 [Rutstroemia sp. NJR-2017a BVV2]